MRNCLVCLFATAAVLIPSNAHAGDVIITNLSDWDIEYVYITADDNGNWGEDRLGPSTILNAGDKWTLNNISCDEYNIKLIDEDGDVCIINNMRMCDEPTTWTINSPDLLQCQSDTRNQESWTYTIQNNTSYAIYQLYFSATSDDEWREDKLGTEVIKAGSEFQITDIGCGEYDLKLVDEDGDECIVNALSICGEDRTWNLTNDVLIDCINQQGPGVEVHSPAVPAARTPPDLGQASFTVVNKTSYTFFELYVSLTEDTHWGEDRLGSEVVMTGSQFTVNGLECAKYDIKIVDEDQDECSRTGIWLCGDAVYSLDNDILLPCEGHTQ